MPRPHKRRKICIPPKMDGFKPFGIIKNDKDDIILQYDEYESIRLVNYDNRSQDDAADLMGVSRPTLTRIYNSALVKIATAFVEGKSIRLKGGNFELEKEWFKCKTCYKLIEGLDNHIKCSGCDRFGNDELRILTS